VTDLIERTTQPGSEQRFTQLCALLGDGMIGSVWMYSSEDPDAVEASIDVLSILVRALGVGATRYLKVSFNTFTYRLKDDQMSGVDSSTYAPTPSGSLQEAANHSPIVFPSCIGNSHTRM
jgi:Tti2 family